MDAVAEVPRIFANNISETATQQYPQPSDCQRNNLANSPVRIIGAPLHLLNTLLNSIKKTFIQILGKKTSVNEMNSITSSRTKHGTFARIEKLNICTTTHRPPNEYYLFFYNQWITMSEYKWRQPPEKRSSIAEDCVTAVDDRNTETKTS